MPGQWEFQAGHAVGISAGDEIWVARYILEVAVALENAALSDESFVKRKLYPNVDFYSGLSYRYMRVCGFGIIQGEDLTVLASD